MTCGVCHHCMATVEPQDSITLHNFSYHKSCKKCFVCSETDLHKAEIFNGVIFCAGCSKRIFQGCYSARRSRNSRTVDNRSSRASEDTQRAALARDDFTRRRDLLVSWNRVRYERNRLCSRTPSRCRFGARRPRPCGLTGQHGIIEMALRAARESQMLEYSRSMRRNSKVVMSTAVSVNVNEDVIKQKSLKEIIDENMGKDVNTETAMATDVTQELLKQINYPLELIHKSPPRPPRPKRIYKEDDNPFFKSNNSDPRILELGTSTEIATMPLRNKSEVPVKPRSNPLDFLDKKSTTTESNEITDSSSREDSLDYRGSYISDGEYVAGSFQSPSIMNLLKVPLLRFKEKIVDRRSFIHDGEQGDGTPIIQKTKKWFFEDEINKHQRRGLKCLYPTITRLKKPYKLGWLSLYSSKSRIVWPSQLDVPRCIHFRTSHSYRCMRALVMSRAGPTKSELKDIRNKIWDCFVPKCIRKLMDSDGMTTIQTSSRSTRPRTHSTGTHTRLNSTRTHSRIKKESRTIRMTCST